MAHRLLRRLKEGKVCLNGWLSIPSGYGAEVMARSAWDSLTVDLQHGVQDYGSMVACFQGASASSATLMARVPSNESGIVAKVLDAGALGVICPMVNSAKEAAEFVSSCRYAPLGRRSFGPNRAAAYGNPGAPYHGFANDAVLAIPMIETVQAIDALESILDVPGVSGVYVGPSDLSLSMGGAPVFDHEDEIFLDIYRRVVAETSRRGQFAGLHCISPDYAARMGELGFRLVTIASDASLMAKAANTAIAHIHDRLGETCG